MLIFLIKSTLPSRYCLGVPIYMLSHTMTSCDCRSYHCCIDGKSNRNQEFVLSLCITSIIIAIMSCTYVQSQFHVKGVAMVTVLYYTQDLKLLPPPHECIPMLFVFFFVVCSSLFMK